MDSNKLNISFKETLSKGKLKDLSFDLTEIGIDSFIKNDFIKSLPFIKIAIGFYDTSLQVQSHFLTKKILKFLYEFKDINEEERIEIIKRIETNKKYSEDFGERLLLVIDSFDDYNKSSLLGKVFKKFAKKEIEIDDFMRISHIINRAYISDLEQLSDFNNCNVIVKESLYNLGLLSIKPKMIENGMLGYEVRKRLNETEYVINSVGKLMIKMTDR